MIATNKHILIVGGTGMLRGVTTYYIEKGHIVSVLARNKKRLERIKEEYPIKKGRIRTISQDYRASEQALQKVKEAAEMYVHIDLAVLWIHDTGHRFSDKIKEFLFSQHPKTKVFQLLGSSSRNPLEMSQTTWRTSYPERYREIFLGFKRTGSSPRWLTNREISKGTVKSVELDKKKAIIGTMDGWNQRS